MCDSRSTDDESRSGLLNKISSTKWLLKFLNVLAIKKTSNVETRVTTFKYFLSCLKSNCTKFLCRFITVDETYTLLQPRNNYSIKTIGRN